MHKNKLKMGIYYRICYNMRKSFEEVSNLNEKVELVISEDNHLERLDKVLDFEFDDVSRSKIQAMIKEGLVLVNGEETKSNRKVKTGDSVSVTFVPEELMSLEGQDIPLDIRYEDDDVIVVNKERGMVVHPAVGNPRDTLVNALVFHSSSLSDVNGEFRPGIVHRIDKDTTGLLVVAKNNKAHADLSDQLQRKVVSRKYVALVRGVIAHEYGTIDAPIGRDPKSRQKMCVIAENSKPARTHFKVLERFPKYTLVECELETGRTHQIRVHMQYIKHPVVGDDVYGRKDEFAPNGQLLHAKELRFIHPTSKQEIVVEAPLPSDFEQVLQDLRSGMYQ